MRVVIAGYGMAGARLAGELRSRDADIKVTAFGAEPHRPYNRIMLSTLLAGKIEEEDLTLAAAPVDVRLGVAITAIDPARRVVRMADDELEYDALVLATGALPVRPPVDGLDAPTAHPLRTLDDCRAITAAAARARRAVVLGGGLLGLEAARGLAGRGLDVTVVHAGRHVMDRQLDPDAGVVLTRTLRDLGVQIRLKGRATAWTPEGLLLADGTLVEGDLLVYACGVRPDTDLAARAGLAVGRGVIVDDGMRTSDPHIWAIGDCAEHDGELSGLVAPAWEQAGVVADRLTGGTAHYRTPRLVTRLKAGGIDLAAMGDVDADIDSEVVTLSDPARGTYARLVIRDDRLAGAVMLGENPSVGAVVQLWDRDAPVPADRRSLLLGRAFGGEPPTRVDSPAFMPDQAVVCRCNSVTKAAITACWRAGARDARDVAAATRATTGCGSCADAVGGIVDWLATVEPAVPQIEEVPA